MHVLRFAFPSMFLMFVLASHAAAELPDATIPDGLGVCVHFIHPRPGEMRMLAATGITWIRTDLRWPKTERQRGVYDFTAQDKLLAALRRYHIRTLLILAYGNRLYTKSDSDFPVTAIQRAAFVRWAVAAVKHFRGQHVVFEMYNEPNGMGHATAKQYATLALAVGRAIHSTNPGVEYIGPAQIGIGKKWLVPSLKAGLMKQWAGVSIHPYRRRPPETVTADYRALQKFMAGYQVAGAVKPLICGEWGYSTIWMRGKTKRQEEYQGKYLAREFLTNLADAIPLSFWYDWHDDCPNPKDKECHFGMVKFKYHSGRHWIFTPKPAFFACRTLVNELRGLHFTSRVATSSPKDFALLFSGKGKKVWVVWTIQPAWAGPAQTMMLPVPAGRYRLVNYTGARSETLAVNADGLKIHLLTGPQYIAPAK